MRGLLPSGIDVTAIALYSTPIFVAIFVGIVWWVYRKDRKALNDEYAEIPLDDGEPVGDR